MFTTRCIPACLAAAVCCIACNDRPTGQTRPDTHSAQGKTAMKLTSSAFENGQPIPRKYTGEGADLSPPLAWTGAPTGTAGFALLCDDPDAPTPQPWVHWVLYNLPADCSSLPEALPRDKTLAHPPGAAQGKNSWPRDNIGYRGPMPPPGHGRHRYYFKLYALNTALHLPPGLDKQQLLDKIKGHILAEAQLMGTYERK